MAQFVRVPPGQLSPDALEGLLEEFVSRDGTDYGERELSLEEKRENLLRALQRGDIAILYDLDSEHWDFVDAQTAAELLDEEPS
jgi:uncharacterized protein YheU (UPF0270 family)